MTHEHSNTEQSKGFWYTYFGKGGASAMTFLWVIAGLICIFSVLRWG